MNGTTVLVGDWLHSYEEDTADAKVYRRRGFAFPPSRGRPGIEFRSDGIYFQKGPGADDRGAVREGRWRDLGAGQVEISFPAADRPPTVLTVLSSDGETLRIAK
jgi:hypothetical protein